MNDREEIYTQVEGKIFDFTKGAYLSITHKNVFMRDDDTEEYYEKRKVDNFFNELLAIIEIKDGKSIFSK